MFSSAKREKRSGNRILLGIYQIFLG